jgi:hypothetical protein
MPHDTLLLLELAADGKLSAAAQRLRGQLHVVASLPPRMVVVRTALDARAALLQSAGIAQPHEVDLTEAEQLFADAWSAQQNKSAARPGDGADWDAPGFTPPG